MLTIFQIEITSVCNLRCDFCPHPHMRRKKARMAKDVVEAVCRSLRPGQLVGLHLLGEPLLHPRFFEIVEEVRAAGAVPEINTNGMMLHQPLFPDLARCGLRSITVDVTYAKERRALIQQAEDNLFAFCHYLYYNVKNPPLVRVQIVHRKGTVQEFRPGLTHLAKLCPWLSLHRKFLDTWAGNVSEMQALSSVEPPSPRRRCPEPWARVSVLQNGDVVPCCRDAEGLIVYGNLLHQTLDEIEASSPVLAALREKMQASDWENLPEPCRSCREWHIPMDRDRFQEPA